MRHFAILVHFNQEGYSGRARQDLKKCLKVHFGTLNTKSVFFIIAQNFRRN